MLTRRKFGGYVLGGMSVAAAMGTAKADECMVFDQTRQAETLPDEAITLLREGNARFVAGQSINCDLLAQVRATATYQYPFAAILGCIDSRVPPEMIFDRRIGDMFCARVAGNIANVDIIGSLEYATAVAGAPLIVVLGHNACGAIQSAVDGVELGNITALLAHVDPALATLTPEDGERSSANGPLVQKTAEANARLTAQSLADRSPILQGLVEQNKLRIVAAMHDLHTGEVSWLS